MDETKEKNVPKLSEWENPAITQVSPESQVKASLIPKMEMTSPVSTHIKKEVENEPAMVAQDQSNVYYTISEKQVPFNSPTPSSYTCTSSHLDDLSFNRKEAMKLVEGDETRSGHQVGHFSPNYFNHWQQSSQYVNHMRGYYNQDMIRSRDNPTEYHCDSTGHPTKYYSETGSRNIAPLPQPDYNPLVGEQRYPGIDDISFPNDQQKKLYAKHMHKYYQFSGEHRQQMFYSSNPRSITAGTKYDCDAPTTRMLKNKPGQLPSATENSTYNDYITTRETGGSDQRQRVDEVGAVTSGLEVKPYKGALHNYKPEPSYDSTGLSPNIDRALFKEMQERSRLSTQLLFDDRSFPYKSITGQEMTNLNELKSYELESKPAPDSYSSPTFRDDLRSPGKVRSNYPYSSTPGKVYPLSGSNETRASSQWHRLDKLSTPNSSTFPGCPPNFDILKQRMVSPYIKEDVLQSTSPIRSVITSASKQGQHKMVSPKPGNTFHIKSPTTDHTIHLKTQTTEHSEKLISNETVPCHEDSLLSKKDDLSDDACEESPHPGSIQHTSALSPSTNSSLTYPSHFQHPFLASPLRGPLSIQRLQFGSPRSHSESLGANFPNFDTGRLPGMNPELSAGGQFIGHLSLGQGEEKKIFSCHLCGHAEKTKEAFDAHMNIHFVFNCPHCDYTSRTEGRLKRHIKDFHSDDGSRRVLPGRPKKFKCKQCGFVDTDRKVFWQHAKTHIKEDKLLQCPHCDFVTEYKHHMEYHIRNHLNSKPFKCRKCNYTCVNKSMLNSHLKSHTNVYQYRCSNCAYATKYCHSLKIHLRKYNHRPATVLNQDGSIPLGLDEESSGLPAMPKRGPPRGPRGVKKAKVQHEQPPYLGPMFGVPNAPSMDVGSMINGMLGYFQMGMGSHLPPHAGMLSGIGNIQQPIRGEKNKLEAGEKLSNFQDDEFCCPKCDFVAADNESVCLHFVQAHRREARDVARALGVSQENLQQQIAEPLTESDSESYNGSHSKSTNEESPRSSGQKVSPMCWQAGSPPEQRDLQFCGQMMTPGADSCRMPEMDIIRQMTLKFGNGDLMADKNQPLGSLSSQKDSPLDLTKPKPASPSKSGSQDSSAETDHCPSYHLTLERTKKDDDCDQASAVPRKRSRKGKAYKLDTLCMKLQDRHMTSLLESDESQSDPTLDGHSLDSHSDAHSATKAESCKLDAIMHLETFQPLYPKYENKTSAEKESSSARKTATTDCITLLIKSDDEDTDEYEMIDNDIYGRKRDDICPADDTKVKNEMSQSISELPLKSASLPDQNDEPEFEKLQKSLVMLNNSLSPDSSLKASDHLASHLSPGSDNGTNSNGSSDTMLNIDKNEGKKVDNKLNHADHVAEGSYCRENVDLSLNDATKVNFMRQSTDNDMVISNGNVVELFSLDGKKTTDGSLCFQMGTSMSDCKPSADVAGCGEAGYFKNSRDQPMAEAGEERGGNLQREEIVDPVEMINKVLENRKKPVPPAVRRGTEVAWKLLHDTVNPVVSLPLPLDSPPLTPTTKSTAVSAITTSPISVPTSMLTTSTTRGGINARPQFPPRPVASYLSPHHPLLPHVHMGLPPTPMAFIPPTSHLVPDPVPPLPRPMGAPPPRTAKQDEYFCSYCGVSFQDCVMYTMHMGYHNTKNPFQCNNCGVVCNDKVEFFLHMARSPHT